MSNSGPPFKTNDPAFSDAIELSEFANLPYELYPGIFGHLPLYAFGMDKNINRVCKLFLARANELPQSTKTAQALVDACQSPEDALHILKDEALCKSLPLAKFFRIVSFVPEIALDLVENQPSLLNFPQAVILGERNENIARQMVKKIAEKRSRSRYIEYFMKFHPSIVTELGNVHDIFTHTFGRLKMSNKEDSPEKNSQFVEAVTHKIKEMNQAEVKGKSKELSRRKPLRS